MQVWEIVPGKLWQGSLFGLWTFPCDVAISCTWLSTLLPLTWPVHLSFPFWDTGTLPDMDEAHRVASFAQEQIDANKRVLVSCNEGRNRSGLICGLILSYLMIPNVVEVIRAAHPEALQNQTFVDYLNGAKTRA